jgi:pimeloyl-ACP methyl ester carboxylesterase
MLIQRGGVRLFALEAGKGQPALVFIHGNGADHTAWHNQIAYFSPITKVVAPDLRGFGRSGKDPDSRYTQDTYTADLVAELAALGLRSSILIGWSMGGSLVARVAVEHPELVSAVVLVDHNAGGAGAELGLRDNNAVVEGLRDDFDGRGLRGFINSWFPETGPDVDFLKAYLLDIGRQAGRDVVYGIRGIGANEDRRHWLRELKQPVLICQGGASLLGGKPIAEYLQQLIPHAQAHVFEGKGHGLAMTAADEFNQVLRKFWEEIGAA